MSEVKTNKITSLASNNDITLDPDGTGAVVVDAGHSLGVGTASPESFYSLADDIVLGTGSGGRGLTIYSGSSDSGYIGFNDTASAGMQGFIQYNHNGDYMAFAPNGSEKVRIDDNGNVLVASSTNVGTGDHKVSIQKGTSGRCLGLGTTLTSASIKVSFVNGNGTVGTIQTNGSGTSYNTSSDHRLKEAVVDMTGAIDRVKALAPKRFNFIADDTVTVDGFLAHEAQTIVPEAVSGTHNEVDDDGNAVMQGIDQSKLVPLLTGALREAIAKIETLETKVAALEAGE